MKHILLLFVGLICLNGVAKAAVPIPAITMTTAIAVGESFEFSLTAQTDNTPVQIDFGNGTLVDETIGVYATWISGTIVGTNPIKIYGTGITGLNSIFNQLTNLDVTQCTTLTVLECAFNNLTSLNLSQCTALQELKLWSNKLTQLDIADCPKLNYLDCGMNQLTSLIASACPELKYIRCNLNKISSLDISTCSKLQELDVEYNQLNELSIAHCPDLSSLTIGVNNITTLITSACTKLETLKCSNNQISTLNLNQNIALEVLECYENKLSLLEITQCAALTSLGCSGNQITTLDVTNCSALTTLFCGGNRLSSLNISQCNSLTQLACESNSINIASLPLSQATWTLYFYAPQAPLAIPATIASGTLVDLSAQATINGNATTFTWKTASGTTLNPGTDYTINNGVTTFLKTQSEKVHCEMTNATFPDFTGDNVLKTTEATITAFTTIDSPTAPSIEVYAVDATLYLNLPTAAQVSVNDLQGRIIASTSAESGSSTLALPGSGLYVVRVMAPNGVTTHKVMVK